MADALVLRGGLAPVVPGGRRTTARDHRRGPPLSADHGAGRPASQPRVDPPARTWRSAPRTVTATQVEAPVDRAGADEHLDEVEGIS